MSNLENSIIPSISTAENVSEYLKQLGDPSRLRIFWLLCKKTLCVTQIAEEVNMSSPAVSHHLRVLKSASLISSKRNGKEMYYYAANTNMVKSLYLTIETIAKIVNV